MQKLKQQIKEKKLSNIYLFYGSEKFIINTYINKIVEIALSDGDKSMNYDVYESNSINIDKIIDSIETLPFFSSRRVVIVKDYKIFKSKNSTSGESLLNIVDQIPDTTILIIVEQEVDKRTKLYKALSKKGTVVEFKQLSEQELIKYIATVLNKNNKKIDSKTAQYFIQTVGYDLENIHNELDKLMDFNDSSIVKIDSIDKVCTKTLENKIFELVDCMGTGKRERALKLYHDLIFSKEHPTKILFMLARQFRLIYQSKILSEQGFDKKLIASKIKVPPFVADKCLSQSRNFSTDNLKIALNNCLEVETEIKTGKINPVIGVELIIIKYSVNKK